MASTAPVSLNFTCNVRVLHEEQEVETYGYADHLCVHEEKLQCGHQQIPLGKMSLGVLLLLQGEGH